MAGAIDDVSVEGERFTVEEVAGGNSFKVTWVSGPNPDYGFFITRSAGTSTLDKSGLEEHIREFLAQVDPRTGYIED